MGIRSYLIATAMCVPGVAAGGLAHAQSTTRGTGAEAVVQQSAPAGPIVQPAVPDKKEKQRPRQPAAAQPEPWVQIDSRPPVRREVGARSRSKDASAQPASGAAPAAAAPPAVAGAAGTSAATPPAPVAAGKVWPVLPRPPVPAAVGTAAGVAVGTAAGAATSAAPAPMWSAAEIEQVRAHCTALLKGVDAVMTPQDPIKEGECGSPVVFLVSSVGKGPAIDLVPPVTLTCDMVAAMDKWVKREVQPKARALLGGPVVKIETMSSYSCRNAYGRTKSRLSEHGKANAIDIAGFSTAKDTTTVLAGWGPTVRELKVIAARQEAERAAAAARQGSGAVPKVVGPPAGGGSAPGVPGIVIMGPGGAASSGADRGLGLAPARLGGPKQPDTRKPAPPMPDNDPKSRFLRDIHASACKIFGTVLGPEANNAHKNHFHLDMAPRQRGSFCE